MKTKGNTISKALVKKTLYLLMCICLLICFASCEEEKPAYIGEWEYPGEVTVSVTEKDITLNYTDGETLGPLNYVVSKDDTYTFLECNYEGEDVVFVLVNNDLLAVGAPIDPDDPPDYSYTTPNGVTFSADIGEWYYRIGAWTNDVSFLSEYWQQGLIEEFGTGTTFYYWEHAGIIHVPGYNGTSCLVVTADGNLSGMEEFTLMNMSRYHKSDILAKGNFVITDSH